MRPLLRLNASTLALCVLGAAVLVVRAYDCAGCPKCTCPAPSCIKVIDVCQEDDNYLSYWVAFRDCKPGTAPMARGLLSPQGAAIDWVAFQGLKQGGFASHNRLRAKDMQKALDTTTTCTNHDGRLDTGSCCRQANVNGAGQVNLFMVECNTEPVLWLKDSTFTSCITAASLPGWLVANEGAHYCAATFTSPSHLCGPYKLGRLSCEGIRRCDSQELVPRVKTQMLDLDMPMFSTSMQDGPVNERTTGSLSRGTESQNMAQPPLGTEDGTFSAAAIGVGNAAARATGVGVRRGRRGH